MSKNNTVQAIPVREFLNFAPIDLINDLSGEINVLFEDNVMVRMPASEIIVSRYFWQLFNIYQEQQLISKYKISNYFTNGMFTGKTHTKFLSVLMKDLTDNIFSRDTNSLHKALADFFYNTFDFLESLYSELSYHLVNNATSINVVDLLDIQLHPDLMESMREVTRTMSEKSIYDSYDILDNIIRNDPRYKDNQVAKAYISGMVNANQIKQVLGPRGQVTELDSMIFKYPIANSFTLGLQNMYELAADSRSGAKALYLSNKAIQDSEYFGRELQLATMVIENMVFTDCGSTKYLNWYVKPKEEYNGHVTYKGDLANLEGKWYLNEETGQLEAITKDMTHLYGKTIKLRSAINCQLQDKRQICSKCFGDLAYGVPAHSNLGHLCSTEINSKISQSILSTKHLAASATAGTIALDDVARKFFMVKDKNGYVFRSNVINPRTKISIIISQEAGFGLKDIMLNKNIAALDPGRVTKIEEMTLKVETKTKTDYYHMIVKNGNRYGILEHKFLKHIIDNGFETNENDEYIIDCTNWKSVSPILRLPEVEFSFLALSKDTKDMFKSMSTFKDGTSKDSPESLLSKVFTLVNSKLDLNLALFEVVVYAFTVYDLKKGNYDLGRNSDDVQLANLLTVIDRRSAGASYGYDNLSGKILLPSLFSTKNKCDHKLDVLLAANQVIKNKKA